MDEETIRELKGKLAEMQTALDTCMQTKGKVRFLCGGGAPAA